MAQPKSSKSSSSKSKSASSSSKKVAAPATGKKVSRVVAAKSPKSVELVTEKVAALAPVVVVLPEVVVAEVVELAPAREVSRAEFMELVRKEAYRRAHSRHFRNGSPFQDWVNAEAAVSGRLAAEGARLS